MIGQIHQLGHGEGESVNGSGRALGRASATGSFLAENTVFFVYADVIAASDDLAGILQTSRRAELKVGAFADSPDIGAFLIPGGFNRHTFWCGQSGSGKTYALGVVLEELLLRTRLPMVVLDPDTDFVRIRQFSVAASETETKILASRDVRVLSAKPSSMEQSALRASFVSFSTRRQATVLSLDPLIDRDECNQMLHLQHRLGNTDPDRFVEVLRSSGNLARFDSPHSSRILNRPTPLPVFRMSGAGYLRLRGQLPAPEWTRRELNQWGKETAPPEAFGVQARRNPLPEPQIYAMVVGS